MTRDDLAVIESGVTDLLNDRFPVERLRQMPVNPAIVRQLRDDGLEAGWLLIGLPEAGGGLGGGIAGAAALHRALGSFLAPGPWLPGHVLIESLSSIESFDPDGTIAEGVSLGQMSAAIGQFDWPMASAREEAGALILSGTVPNMVGDADADIFLFSVWGHNGERYLCMVDRADIEVAFTSHASWDVTRSLSDLQLNAARIETGKFIRGRAAEEAVATLRTAADLLIAADCIGGARRVLDLTVEYLCTRVQFGRPVGSFQALKHRCANHKLQLELAADLVEDALSCWLDGARKLPAARLAKAGAADAYADIAHDAIQLHGGIGFTQEHETHLFLKRARMNQLLFTSPACLLDAIATDLLEDAATPEQSQ